MSQLPKKILYDGVEDPLPEQIALRAGPLTLLYEAGTLRYIRLGQHEILRQLYAAVRDRNWGTVVGQLSDVVSDVQPDSFHISFVSTHIQRDLNIDFVWHGDITGTADGSITFKFDGEARSTFERNRIGFCVLHPMTVAGQACVVEHVDGSTTDGAFPLHISPHQPFFDMRAITHEVLPGVKATVSMEGDTFEMEDQRNWTDASYKTYCTPLSLPFPVTVKQGDKVSQCVTITLSGDIPHITTAAPDSITIKLTGETKPLPKIGLGVVSDGTPLDDYDIERLKRLNLSHLRVDVRLSRADAMDRLQQATDEANAIGTQLEVALFVSDNADDELRMLREKLGEINPPLLHWLIFHEDEKSTRAQWVRLAREYLADYGDGIPLGAGTDAFFTELNRERPPVADIDLVTYSLNPQVHAFDNDSLVETLIAQGTTVTSTRAFVGDMPIGVSPVTLFMRWNPNATGSAPAVPPGELPPQVDVRQMSLFGAGWTLGSIKYLAESGVHSATYYETVGWLGVMERSRGSPLPDKFRSIAGAVFPMYHVFAQLADFAGGEVIVSQSSDNLAVDSLVLRKDGRTRILLANFKPHSQTVSLPDVRDAVIVKHLDERNAEYAMREAEDFLMADSQLIAGDANGLTVELLPYAIAWIDDA